MWPRKPKPPSASEIAERNSTAVYMLEKSRFIPVGGLGPTLFGLNTCPDCGQHLVDEFVVGMDINTLLAISDLLNNPAFVPPMPIPHISGLGFLGDAEGSGEIVDAGIIFEAAPIRTAFYVDGSEVGQAATWIANYDRIEHPQPSDEGMAVLMALPDILAAVNRRATQ